MIDLAYRLARERGLACAATLVPAFFFLESRSFRLSVRTPEHLRGGPQGNLNAGAGRGESKSKRETISVGGEFGGVANTDS